MIARLFRLFILASLSVSLFSCVPTKKYNDLANRCKEESSRLNGKVDVLTTQNNEQSVELLRLRKDIEGLREDTARMGTSLRQVTRSYDELSKNLDLNKEQLAGNRTETEKLLTELKKTQDDLLTREDRLRQLESELDLKSKRLLELQTILAKKDSVVQALRKTVTDALLGFEGKGLTINVKNGKVYVSLEESLLFASGKYDVSTQGSDALKKLAKVLEKNAEINVVIEGHTDNVPFNGTGQIKDNWDLSVMRATAIVKIITNNSKVDPKRLMAAGRSEYSPVDAANTKEARSKNRRTEIILTPKLDELFQIIEMN
ncbi:MAG TPA: OmpA family protein [Bacteroidales bacterium]